MPCVRNSAMSRSKATLSAPPLQPITTPTSRHRCVAQLVDSRLSNLDQLGAIFGGSFMIFLDCGFGLTVDSLPCCIAARVEVLRYYLRWTLRGPSTIFTKINNYYGQQNHLSPIRLNFSRVGCSVQLVTSASSCGRFFIRSFCDTFMALQPVLRSRFGYSAVSQGRVSSRSVGIWTAMTIRTSMIRVP